MANTVPRRERPVDHSNRYPRGAAYACVTEKDNKLAERVFRLAYQEQSHGQNGPYANPAIAIFNNWIIALIKLYRYDEAEAQCRSILHSMEASDMQASSCFVCVQCNLAASLYLSGHLPAAEELFDTIRARQDVVSNNLPRDFFEVLSLVRLTKNDCLVFRESSANFTGLVQVNDYTNLPDGKRPKKSSWRSNIGLLRKVASLGQGLGQVGAKGYADKLDGPRALLKRVFRLDRGRLISTTPRLGSISATFVPIREPDLCSQHDTSASSGQQYARALSPIPWPITNTPLQPVMITGEATHFSQPDIPDMSSSSDEVEHEAAMWPISWPINHEPIQPLRLMGEANHQSQPSYTDILDSSDDSELETHLVVARNNVSSNQLSIDHTLRPSSTLRNSFDAAQGMTHRSHQTTTSSQDADSEDLTLLAVTAWAADRIIRTEMQVNVLLDGGARRNLASLGFAHAINAQILPAEDAQLSNPDGSALEHLGRIKVGISFKGPAGTRVEEIRCLVVRTLPTALVIGHRIIRKFGLGEASKAVIFGPILLNPRSNREKRDNDSYSKAIDTIRKEQEERLAGARKAERAMTAAPSTPAGNPAPAKPKASTLVRVDSPLGGSDTTAASPRSSMTFHCRSNTASTAASSPSLRTNSSDSHRASGFSKNAANAALPTASDASHALQRKGSHHRRSDAQDLGK